MTKQEIDNILDIFNLDDITIVLQQVENEELREYFTKAWNKDETITKEQERKIFLDVFSRIANKIKEAGQWEYFESVGFEKKNQKTFSYLL